MSAPLVILETAAAVVSLARELGITPASLMAAAKRIGCVVTDCPAEVLGAADLPDEAWDMKQARLAAKIRAAGMVREADKSDADEVLGR